ncbi:hypothetical protein ACJX0J_020882 [Zea mays]
MPMAEVDAGVPIAQGFILMYSAKSTCLKEYKPHCIKEGQLVAGMYHANLRQASKNKTIKNILILFLFPIIFPLAIVIEILNIDYATQVAIVIEILYGYKNNNYNMIYNI